MGRCTGPDDYKYLSIVKTICSLRQGYFLFRAVLRDNVDGVREIVQSDFDELSHGLREKALHIAASLGLGQVVNYLLVAGADIDFQDSSGETALHKAVKHGWGHLVPILLERGANDGITDKKNRLPMQIVQRLEPHITESFRNPPLIVGPPVDPDYKAAAHHHYSRMERLPRLTDSISKQKQEISNQFIATVGQFFVKEGHERWSVKSVSMNDLFSNIDHSRPIFGQFNMFRWYHIPTNNVRLSPL
jgi:ankyrin repeat protein